MLPFLLIPFAFAASGDPDACPTVGPSGYVIDLAWASGRTPDAIDQARAEARRKVEARFCAGRSPACCEAVGRYIINWGVGEFISSGRKGRACAAVVVPASFLDTTPEACDAFSGQFIAIAESVKARAGSLPIALEPTTWSTGCVAGMLGSAVAGEFKARLVGARLLPADQPQDEALRVLPEISPGSGGSVRLVVSVQAPGESAPLVIGDLSFFPAFSSLTEDEVKQCRPNDALGLSGHTRAGEGGLTVDVRVPTRDGAACDGDRLEGWVQVNRPARVQVWSVSREGEGFLVWPPPGQGGRVESVLSLGAFHVVRSDDGDERLVAVAVPDGVRFGLSEGWTGFCKVSQPFGDRYFPAGAAVGTTTWTVFPSGVGGCEGGASSRVIQAAVDAPSCGAR